MRKQLERQPDPSLPPPLGNQIRDQAVDPDHAQQQRHATRQGQQRQRESRRRQRPFITRRQRFRLGQIRVHARHGGSDLLV
jgi:hypothetical protein